MTIAIFLFSLLGAMALGMPIAFSLLVCGAAMMLFQGNFDATILSQKIVEGTDSFPLLAIPFFLLSGELMNAGGISRRIVDFALAWVGHIRGGLGLVAIMASVIMAAMSGAAAADAAALGALLIPMMRSAGYDVRTAGGLLSAGSVIAPVIPPSIGLIVFGVIANVSIGKLFLAGIFPGILMGVSLVFAWIWVVRKQKIQELPPDADRPAAARHRARRLGAVHAGRDYRRSQARRRDAHRGRGVCLCVRLFCRQVHLRRTQVGGDLPDSRLGGQDNGGRRFPDCEMMKAKGVVVNDVAPAELKRIRDKTKPVSDSYASKLNPDAVSMVFNELKLIRSGK